MCKILDMIDVNEYGIQGNGRGYGIYKKLNDEVEELAASMPWITTEKSDSIHIEDSAKYSRNKLNLFGNLTQETRNGINLINTSEQLNNTVNGITKVNNKDGSLTLTGTATAETKIQLKTGTLEEGTYTYKCFGNQTDCVTNIYYVGNVAKENIRAFTVSADSTNSYVFMYIIAKDVTINVTIKPMLVKGEYTSDTFPIFEQYGEMPSIDYLSMPQTATGVQKITKIGKNYLNSPDTDLGTISGVTIKIENNKIILNGTVTNGRTINLISTLKIALNGTYTFSQKTLSGNISNGTYRFGLSDKDTLIIDSPLTFTSKTCTVTNTIDTVVTDLKLYLNPGIVFDNYTIQLQLEKGSVSTEFEPYQGEIFNLDLGETELCKIVDNNKNVVAQDRAVYREVDGIYKWQWEKQISKYILDKNTTVYYGYLDGNYYVGQVRKTPALLKNSILISSYLPYIKNNYNQGKESVGIGGSSSTSIQIRILASRLTETTTNGLKEYLTNNPLVVYGVLNTFSYEDCTSAQSEVLDKLYKLSLQQGVNNIFVASENGVTTELQLEYMQNLNSKLNQLEAMIVSNASEEVTE